MKDEAIDVMGDRLIFPVSVLVVRSTVILRLHDPAGEGSFKEIQSPPVNLRTNRQNEKKIKTYDEMRLGDLLRFLTLMLESGTWDL